MSCAIALFLLIIQPLGLNIDSVIEVLVVAGFAPLNFVVMLTLHSFSFGSSLRNVVFRAIIIVGANIIYLRMMSETSFTAYTVVKVMVVAGLVFAAIRLWNRQRVLTTQVLELRARPVTAKTAPLTISGTGERDILKLSPDDLYFVKAEGNYVSIFLETET